MHHILESSIYHISYGFSDILSFFPSHDASVLVAVLLSVVRRHRLQDCGDFHVLSSHRQSALCTYTLGQHLQLADWNLNFYLTDWMGMLMLSLEGSYDHFSKMS